MTETPDIIIVGAGIGGLALAQGLVQSGFGVRVFERDPGSASRSQGYRLSLTPDGLDALHRLLPADRWSEIVAACTAPLDGISFLSQRLEPRFFKATPAATDEVNRFNSISRATLRAILLSGIKDRVSFGSSCVGFEEENGGRVACILAGGGRAWGDVLVGADGTRSAIRTQLLPNSNRYSTGIAAIAGRIMVEGDEARRLTAPPIGDSAVVIGDAPQGLFIANHQLASLQPGESHLFWSFLSAAERFPTDLRDASPQRLIQVVDDMTADWHPRLKSLLHKAVPSSVTLLDYASSRPPEEWGDRRVTLLGDAIHNMPPTGGEGANMALRDALGLHTAIVGTARKDLSPALTRYRSEMVEYAFQAVGRAMANLDRMVAGRR